MSLKMLSLFSGIGGIDLAAQWAGIETVAFCEIDKFCQQVLRKHWPGVPIFDDVRTLTAESLRARGITGVDILCGGFPCQDISVAGKGAGIEGERSGLWREMFRIICELRPNYILVENVAALLGRGAGRVLGDFASVGYDAEWETIPACAFGAPHTRERLFIIAYTTRTGLEGLWEPAENCSPGGKGQDIAAIYSQDVWRDSVTAVLRVDDGISNRVHRIKGCGNSVVPQQVFPILKAIAEIEASSA